MSTMANVKMQNTKDITQRLGDALLVHVAIATSVLMFAAYCCHTIALTTTSANETIRIQLQQQRPHRSFVNKLQECHCLNQANRSIYYGLPDTTPRDSGAKFNRAQCDRQACHLAMRALTFQPYTGRMQLGTPPQVFEFLFDTGSDIIWVPHSKCRLNNNSWDSELRLKFANDKSSTFKRINRDRVHLRYANQMEFDGWWVKDTIRVLDTQDNSRSLTVPDQALALICSIKGADNHYDDGFDGLVGLSFRTADRKNWNTLLENMIQNGLLREPVFSFYTSYTSTDISLTQQRTSELVFGQIDAALYTGPITWTPVTKLPYWQIRIHSIKLMPRDTSHGSDTHERAPIACKHGCEAAVDTGTSLIVGPSAEIAQINEMLGFVRYKHDSGLYVKEGPCAMHDTQDLLLVFEINGAQLEIETENFMFDLDEGDTRACISSLRSHAPGQEGLPWIFGAPFVSSFYTIFDLGHKRVGFAKPAISSPHVPARTHYNPDEAGPSSRPAGTLNL